MAGEVFLSHSSRDAAQARRLRTAIASVGVGTWMAPDDVVGSRPWAEQISNAIASASLLVVLISDAANRSDHVAREVALAVGRHLPVVPVQLEDAPPSGSLGYLLQLDQRVDASVGGIERHADAIAARVLAVIRSSPSQDKVEGVAPRPTRRIVTAVVVEVRARSTLDGQVDPEALGMLTSEYFREIKPIVERHGGTVDEFVGGALAVFGIPTLHEDDAVRAVRAASTIRDALSELDAEYQAKRGLAITFRIGISTGEVIAGDAMNGNKMAGDTANAAARLAESGGPGEILLTQATSGLVRDAVSFELVDPITLDVKSPKSTYRLLSVSAHVSGGHARRLLAPLVGREREIGRLHEAYRTAIVDRACQLFTLLGAAGVGKSRLVVEFLGSVSSEATVLKGRCLPYGEGITYWALREIVNMAAGIGESDTPATALSKLEGMVSDERDGLHIAARVASAIGLSADAAPQEEIFWATRKLLEHVGRRRPLVVLVEDIHWAEPAFLDLLEHVVDLARDVPLVVLCPARPDLLDKRPGWGGGKVNATSILLEPLAGDASDQLIDALPGGNALPPSLRKRILTVAEGNPLYLEEMLGMLIDEGVLANTDGSWRVHGEVDTVRVPPTIRALLAARLDQLPVTERAIAECASVVGRVFEQDAVSELAPHAIRAGVARGLMALVRKELVRPERSDLVAGDTFKFRHLLIRDAAYEALPKADRAQLHERFADWLERAADDRLSEHVEIIAYHLEQAHRYRVDLGEDDAVLMPLAARAAEFLVRSGEPALGRGDLSAALDLFRRATAILDPGNAWAEAAMLLGVVEGLLGDGAAGIAHLDEVVALASSEGNESLEWRARVARANITFFIGEPADSDMVEHAIEVFGRLGETNGLAGAWLLFAFHAGASGDPRQAEGAANALEYARAASNKHIEARALLVLAGRLPYGPIPTSEAVVEGERLLDQAENNLRAAAIVRTYVSFVIAMRGDFDQARTMAVRARLMLEELGLVSDAAWARGVAGVLIEMLAGSYDTAEAELRASYPVLETLGKTRIASSVAASLAETLVLQGKPDEAERLVIDASTKPLDDYDPEIRWLRARARLQAHHHDFGEAERLARAAVELSIGTDDINMQADCLIVLAHVLKAGGQMPEARAALYEALTRYDQKENLVSAQRTRAALGDLSDLDPN
ncbi:MAG: AAA family ATPase [Chloroflexota bacterium]